MIFLKRTKPIVVRFYTNLANAHRLFKPDHAGKFLPDWTEDKKNENRSCVGMRKMFSNGIGVPLWSDLDLDISTTLNNQFNLNFTFANGGNYLELMGDRPPASVSKKILIKLMCPWLAECSEEINFVSTENMWGNPNRGVEFVSGVTDFKFQYSTNMFFYASRAAGRVQLNAGDVPIIWKAQSERDVQVESLYDPERYRYLAEAASLKPFRSFNYMKIKNILKK